VFAVIDHEHYVELHEARQVGGKFIAWFLWVTPTLVTAWSAPGFLFKSNAEDLTVVDYSGRIVRNAE